MFSVDRAQPKPPRPRMPWPLVPVAWLLRRVAAGIAVIAVWQRALLRRLYGVRWQLTGACQSCGRCCDNLLLPLGARAATRWSLALRRFWHEQVFDFYPKPNVLDTGAGQLRAYGCRNLTADRRCARYALRPFVCRVYPALALYARPAPKPHCGFRVIDD